MREILFRGKLADQDEWVEGSLVLLGEDTMIFAVRDFPEGTGMFSVASETVGQYTGLHDQNGKKIFEGDIIKSYQGKILAVKFGQYRDDEEVVSGNGWYVSGEYGTLSFDERWGGHEVIGNIHDNPELYISEDIKR